MAIPTFNWIGPRPAIESYTFDPKGDVLFKLTRRYEREKLDEPDSESSSIAGDDEDPDTFPGSDNVTVQEDATMDENASIRTNKTSITEQSIILLNQPVHMRVSSRHLMLASRVFDAMLDECKFKEGATLHSKGSVDIELPDDDPDAFAILLDILHGRTREVPRKVSLLTLTQLAILVNKYEMLIAVEIFSNMWIRRLSKRGLPDNYSFFREDVVSWLFISWVFEKPKIFKSMTGLIIQQASHILLDQDLESDLPIPHTLLEMIHERRLEAIDSLVSILSSLINKYTLPTPQCLAIQSSTNPMELAYCYACDSMVLGSMIKSCSKMGIFPLPQTPFNQVSFEGLAKQLMGLELKSKCDGKLKGYFVNHACHGVRDAIRGEVETLVKNVRGLDLKDFKKLDVKVK